MSNNAEIDKVGCSACRGSEWAHQDSYRRGRNCQNKWPQLAESAPIYEGIEDLMECPRWPALQATNFVVAYRLWSKFGIAPEGYEHLREAPSYWIEAFSLLEAVDRAANIKLQAQLGGLGKF